MPTTVFRPNASGYSGRIGSLPVQVPPTSASYVVDADLQPIIQGLLTPGLVPDIARQSAEIAAGRGIAGSPAADSTAVRMSEQNYLQRLGLANALLSGEASRSLPYQITPYQSVETALRQQALQNQRDIAQAQFAPRTSGGGGGRMPSVGATGTSAWAGFTQPFIGQQPIVGPTYGTRPDDYMGSLGMPTGTPSVGGGGGGMSLDAMLQQLGVFDETGAEGFNWEDLGLGL